MKITFDREANAAYIKRLDSTIVDSETVDTGIVYDYDRNNRVVGIEILNVSYRSNEQWKWIYEPMTSEEKKELDERFQLGKSFELATA